MDFNSGDDFAKQMASAMSMAQNQMKMTMAQTGMYQSIDELLSALADIESRENYLEMTDVLLSNIRFEKDPNYSLYLIKCVANGGLSSGDSKEVLKILSDANRVNDAGSGILDKFANKISDRSFRKSFDNSKNVITLLTNGFFINGLRNIVAYGNNEQIGAAVKLLSSKFLEFNNLKSITSTMYSVITPIMCNLGNTIVDIVEKTNKTNFPSSKNLIGIFTDNIMERLMKPIKGFFGFLYGLGFDKNIIITLKDTYKRLKGKL